MDKKVISKKVQKKNKNYEYHKQLLVNVYQVSLRSLLLCNHSSIFLIKYVVLC